MKLLFTVFVFLALEGASAWAADTPAPPAAKDIEEVFVQAYPGWTLIILADGSARLLYGATRFGLCPAKTFNLAQVCRSLAPTVHVNDSVTKAFVVAYSQHGASETVTYYTQNSGVVLPLFGTAKMHLEFGQGTIKEMWQKTPPKSPGSNANGM